LIDGCHILRAFVGAEKQLEILRAVEAVIAEAPLVTPVMPDGKPFRCEVTGAGAGAFYSTRGRGYHYATVHPETGCAWPAVPLEVLRVGARALARLDLPATAFDSLLVNRYAADLEQSLGLHRDEMEEDLDSPIVLISLGADCEFWLGGLDRRDPREIVVLSSGDVLVLSGPSRMLFHGVKAVLPVMFSPLEHGVRLSLSLRRVFRNSQG